MKPWLERPVGADAAATHALVIGTSYYEFLPQRDEDPDPTDRETFGLRQAKTPATSAWTFAKWLRDSYNNPNAPLGSVRLLLSPSDWEKQQLPELDALPQEVLRATRDNVEEAVDEWHEAANTNAANVAILYASGHGIQLSKDEGGIVLLEDFAKRTGAPLNHSLDVGAVRKGMAGATIAQQQFYFVDACEVRPREAVDYQSLGEGVGLKNPYEGAPLCSAVYFSASPSTEALGQPGKGTLFIQALLDCLELGAVDGHVHENGWWVVTTSTLMKALPLQVSELARAFKQEQTPTTGGQLAEVIFHVLPGRPEVPVTLELEPSAAADCVLARLLDEEENYIFDEERFVAADPAPILAKPVPAGQYILKLNIQPPTPPYRNREFSIPALPPGYRKKVLVG